MPILFAYVFRKAAFMCSASLIGLVALIVLSFMFGNLSMFAQYDTDLVTALTYLMFSVPQMMYWVFPFSVCLGIIAAQASFSRHAESIAMQACSVSTVRMFLPYIAVGLLSAIFMSLLSFAVYPLSQRNADRIENIYIKKKDVQGSFTVSGGRFKVENDIYFVEHLDIEKGLMQKVSCYRLKSGTLSAVFTAERATWNGHSWIPEDMVVITLDHSGIHLEEGSDIFPLSRGPEELVMAQPRPEVLTLTELSRYRTRLAGEGIVAKSLDTIYHSRISFSFAPLIMTVLVLPFGKRFPRSGGIARGIALGLVLGLAYWASQSAMTSLGASGMLAPVTASWITNILALLSAGILLFMKRGAYG
ncbi:MAG: LptF/LptG family permease [Desulfomonilia bacterium]|nr:LptF/LptG family permease [Desulfomonilia bacterium]